MECFILLKASVSWTISRPPPGIGTSGASYLPATMSRDAPIICCTGSSSRITDQAMKQPSTRQTVATTVCAHFTRPLRADTSV